MRNWLPSSKLSTSDKTARVPPGLATYVVGDLHGCYRTLKRLLKKIDFDEEADRLWLAGDLVNRGPDSLEIVNWARRRSQSMGKRFRFVLGNHDVHLIAYLEGIGSWRHGLAFEQFLDLKRRKRTELLDWLRCQPLMIEKKVAGRRFVLVHAGLLPSWNLETARERARSTEQLLATGGLDAVRAAPAQRRDLDVFTRIRCCDAKGRPVDFAGPPEKAPKGVLPWFAHPKLVLGEKATVLFGHWAALGHRSGKLPNGGRFVALDGGAGWGRRLYALRLDDGELYKVRSELPAYF